MYRSIGMLYGSRIMHQIAKSWVDRYAGLRQCRSLNHPSHVKKLKRRIGKNSVFRTKTKFKSKTSELADRLAKASEEVEDFEDIDQDDDAYYRKITAGSKKDSFGNSNPSEKKSISSKEEAGDNTETGEFGDGVCDMSFVDKDTPYSRSLLIENIEADAYEIYLFLQVYFRFVLSCISVVISCLCILCVNV